MFSFKQVWNSSSSSLTLEVSFKKSEEITSSDWPTLGTRKIKPSVASLKIFLIRTTNHKLVKSDLVTCSRWRTMPPAHLDESEPRLSMHISRAKKVPSMPKGQSLVLRMIMGIHLTLATTLEMHSSMTTKR